MPPLMDSRITLDVLCAPSDDVVARDIEGDLIIVPLVAGIGDADDELYTLNETGRAIWEALDGSRSLGEVVDLLSERFEAPRAELEADVLGFAAEMLERRIFTRKG
jgi:hypothetical protein